MKKTSWHAKWYRKHVNRISYPTTLLQYIMDFVYFFFFKIFSYGFLCYILILVVYGWFIFFTDYHLKHTNTRSFFFTNVLLIWGISCVCFSFAILVPLYVFVSKKIKKLTNKYFKPISWED